MTTPSCHCTCKHSKVALLGPAIFIDVYNNNRADGGHCHEVFCPEMQYLVYPSAPFALSSNIYNNILICNDGCKVFLLREWSANDLHPPTFITGMENNVSHRIRKTLEEVRGVNTNATTTLEVIPKQP
jgi:hypothetical protein